METSTKVLLLLALFVLIAAYLFINLIRQQKADKEIQQCEDSYQKEVNCLGISFQRVTHDREPTPGTSDITFTFKGLRIDAELTPLQALYFLKSVRKGTPDIAFLKKKSYWKLPQLSS